jgi:calmodulin
MSDKKIRIPEEVLSEYKDLFDSYDKNKNGEIERKEMKIILKKLGKEGTEEEIDSIWKSMNKIESDTTINFDDFLTFIKNFNLSKNSMSTDDIINAFEMFDKNHNGTISINEFKHILMDLGQKFSENEVNEIIKEIDLDDNGKINYREFVQFWQEQ